MDLLGEYGDDDDEDQQGAMPATTKPAPAPAAAKKVIPIGALRSNLLGTESSSSSATSNGSKSASQHQPLATTADDDVVDDWPKKRKASPPRAATVSSFLSMLPQPKNAAGGGLGGGKGALLGGLTSSISLASRKNADEQESKRAAVEAPPLPAAQQKDDNAEEQLEQQEEQYEEEEEEEEPMMGPSMPSQAAQMQYAVGAQAHPAYVPYEGYFGNGEENGHMTEVQQVVESMPQEFRRDKLLQHMGVHGKIVDVSQRDIQQDAEQARKDKEANMPLWSYRSANAPTLQAPMHKLAARKGQLGYLAYQAQQLEAEVLQKAAMSRKGQGCVKSRYGW